jgi:hypothetical protein
MRKVRFLRILTILKAIIIEKHTPVKKTIIFEGMVTLAGQLVDFLIYKNEEA